MARLRDTLVNWLLVHYVAVSLWGTVVMGIAEVAKLSGWLAPFDRPVQDLTGAQMRMSVVLDTLWWVFFGSLLGALVGRLIRGMTRGY